ncbi:MAG: 4Fe-4S dicluster domain-containing protein [Deltaproteobacteria bacterium]|nr:4Fe-4S dicluster domain-containing protein [Deltaproteobacteria bacterium]
MTGRLLSAQIGPYVWPKNSFRGYNLEIILSLAPYVLVYLTLRPSLWPTVALALSLGLFFLTNKILKRLAPQTLLVPLRDLDPLGGSLATLAILGPCHPKVALAAALAGALTALNPGLIRRPGLSGLLLGLILVGEPIPPPPWAYLALAPGFLGLLLTNRLDKIPGALFLLSLLAAGALDPSPFAVALYGPYFFVLWALGPTKPRDFLAFALTGLAVAGALLGGSLGFIFGLILWGLADVRASRPQTTTTVATDKGQERDRLLTDPSPYRAVRLCRREKGAVKVLAETKAPYACRLTGPILACAEACLGFGDCAMVCPTQAISLNDMTKAPLVDPSRCVGCGLCAKACPYGLFELIPKEAKILIPCRGSTKMKAMAAMCQVGCLGCGRCARACPARALSRPDKGPPVVNHRLCLSYGQCDLACQAACPKGIPQKP